MNDTRRAVALIAPLLVGVVLLVLTIARMEPVGDLFSRFAVILPVALLPSAAWHVLRTIAWRQCFPADAQPSFARAFRVRLAAEAFSFVTIRGVAGEPLKVVLLEGDVARTVSAAAVALERVAYILITTVIVAVAGVVAVIALPLTRMWIQIFAAMAGVAAAMVILPVVLVARRNAASATSAPREGHQSVFARFVRHLHLQLRDMVRGDRRRLATLLVTETAAYAMMALEVWAVLYFTPTPVTVVSAMAVETFTRVASMVSVFIPANLGALEASNVAAATAVHAAGGAAVLALARRCRGIVWCAAGFLVYPRPGARARKFAQGQSQTYATNS